MADVMPYLENVLRGRNVPRARMEEVARHYALFDGVSPINEQNRLLIEALRSDLARQGVTMPVYFGNRNWHPYLTDTVRQMAADGVRRALAFVTSAYSSYSGCRQYREDIARAREEVGPGAPHIDKIRVFYNHPEFIAANAANLQAARGRLSPAVRADAAVVFTAHSLPLDMARHCAYEEQLTETCGLVAEAAGCARWVLAYQSRSGPPHQPWLEPDVCDVLRNLKAEGAAAAVVAPVGFLSDHLEVLFDLDVEARETAEEIGLPMERAATAGDASAVCDHGSRADPGTAQRSPGPESPGHARPVSGPVSGRMLSARKLTAVPRVRPGCFSSAPPCLPALGIPGLTRRFQGQPVQHAFDLPVPVAPV